MVRLGQAGEDTVRSAYAIGNKVSSVVEGGRLRIFDGFVENVSVSEVKNVARQALTLQLRDTIGYASSNNLRFDLFVRPSTYLTAPLRDAIRESSINLRFTP
jgi:hypothetical protein